MLAPEMVNKPSGGCRLADPNMIFDSNRNRVFDTIEEVSGLASPLQIADALGRAVADYGYTSFGFNGLPPPANDADPLILAESAPGGFREWYVEERFYLVDHICAHARTTYEAFRFRDAPYPAANEARHRRFLDALESFGVQEGLVIPIGRPENIPTCAWLAGPNPDVNDGAKRAVQLITMFAASKAYARRRPAFADPPTRLLTAAEREALQWISAGKTSWEIASISGRSERTINKIIADAMLKLNAVTRTQAVVNAIRTGEIEI
jgi:LuxR family transcriptional regulator, quorum-sensing system regulator BjaR1